MIICVILWVIRLNWLAEEIQFWDSYGDCTKTVNNSSIHFPRKSIPSHSCSSSVHPYWGRSEALAALYFGWLHFETTRWQSRLHHHQHSGKEVFAEEEDAGANKMLCLQSVAVCKKRKKVSITLLPMLFLRLHIFRTIQWMKTTRSLSPPFVRIAFMLLFPFYYLALLSTSSAAAKLSYYEIDVSVCGKGMRKENIICKSRNV